MPIIGGTLPNDVFSLEPGYVSTVRSLFRGYELAILQHALIGIFVMAALLTVVLRRKILQLPQTWIGGPLTAFLLLLMASVLISRFRWVSVAAFGEWAVYSAGLLAVVGGLGRKVGPVAMIGTLAASCGLVAVRGIVEYLQTKAIDPTWRIFAGWQNPNALGGMLVIGLFVGLGFGTYHLGGERGRPRAGLVVAGLGSAVLCGTALLLTGSKGSVLSEVVGVVVMCALAIGWRRPAAVFPVLGCVVLSAGLFAAITHGGASAPSRLVSGATTEEQSSGFRIQLWKGALALIEDNPIGSGLDSYAYYSAKPGTNTRTELAHETWLQLGVEAGFLAPIALAALLVGWLVGAFRGSRSQPKQRNLLKAAVVAAVLATAFDGLIESNLYFFGIGLAFFLLLGVGVQLSADSSAPEFVANPMRVSFSAFGVACMAVLLYAGFVGKLQANLRYLLSATPQPGLEADTYQAAMSTAETLRSIAPFDGETWYRSALIAPDADKSIVDLKEAVAVAPSAKYFRRLAQTQMHAGKLDAARESLEQALSWDPRNLETLLQLMQVQDKLGLSLDARDTAQRLIAVEKTSYFTIRALPQVVPTETYEARIYLAQSSSKPEKLIRDAVAGLLEYAKVTLPYARAMSSAGTEIGLSLAEARSKTQIGLDASRKLEALYRAEGDATGVAWADKAVADFESALESNK